MMRLYGKNQIIERIKIHPQSIKKIYLNKNHSVEFISKLTENKKIPCIFLDNKEFSGLALHDHTQDVMADVDEFLYTDFDYLLSLPEERKYTLVALSNITDPQNMGSILRTLACFGGFALLIPRHRTASVNETVLKVACGGENYVPVVQVTNLIPALEKAKKLDYWIAGTVVEGGRDLTKFKFTFPLCIVIGSEDKGIRKGLLAHLDFKVTLPMPGASLSLNTAVACAIFCYETLRQKRVTS